MLRSEDQGDHPQNIIRSEINNDTIIVFGNQGIHRRSRRGHHGSHNRREICGGHEEFAMNHQEEGILPSSPKPRQ